MALTPAGIEEEAAMPAHAPRWKTWSIGVALALPGLTLVPPAAAGDCPGDTDGNGRVDSVDLVNVILTWACGL